MVFRRGLCLIFPIAFGLLGQTAPPQTGAPPQPTVTMGVDTSKPRPTLPPDHIVLSVADVQLTAAHFDLLVDSLPEQYRASARGPGRKAFADQVVRILVLAQEGKRRKLDASP